MPSQQKKWSKPGSSQTTAIALDSDDSSSELGAHAAPASSSAVAARGGNVKTATTSPARSGLRSRTKATAPVKPASKRAVPVSSKRPHEELEVTSDSDYSSDAIFVATSRATDKGKQRETSSTTRKAPSSANKTAQVSSRKQSSKTHDTPSVMEVDGETDSSVEKLPTPESLVTEESEPPEPRRLVKADRTPVKKASADQPSTSSSGAARGPTFLERLESNARPQFSKTLKGKVRSSMSTSIPLDDDRFRSDEDDEDYESEDRPSPRKKSSKRKASPAKVSPKKAATSSQTIELEDSDDEGPPQKRQSPKHTTIDSSSDDALPNIPGSSRTSAPSGSTSKSSQFKESLEELNKRRRLSDKKNKAKKKHAARVVASPSPSPEPVKVVASRPAEPSPLATSSARAKQRINIRAISSKGRPPKKKVPMFRAPSDDSDRAAPGNDTSASTDSDDEIVSMPKKQKKGPGKDKKLQRRNPTPSSSSSSSSSESSASPDDDEMSEVEEDITLDFNPLVKDKLRPKDNSKAHRLDKLKEARAAKELREEKRRRGIIDSDEDDTVNTAKASIVDDEEDEEESDSSSVGGIENFIVEDDGDIDPDELDRVQRMMPTQFSKHGALPLKDHFRIFVASVVFRYFLPKSRHYRDKPEFTFSQLQVQNAIDGLTNGSIASAIWEAEFRAALDTRPELEMHKIPLTSGCDGCNKYDRTASEQAIVSGKPYDHDTLLEDTDEEEEPPQVFDLGRFCAEKAYFHHSLRHFLKHAADEIRAECRRKSTLGDKLMGDKDDRKEQREKEASRLVDIISSGSFPLQQRLWGELDQLMERAKHKYLK